MGNEQARIRQQQHYQQQFQSDPQQQNNPHLQTRSVSPNYRNPQYLSNSQLQNNYNNNNMQLEGSMKSQQPIGASHNMARRKRDRQDISKVYTSKVLEPSAIDHPELFDRNTLTSKPVCFMTDHEAKEFNKIKDNPEVQEKLDLSKHQNKSLFKSKSQKKHAKGIPKQNQKPFLSTRRKLPSKRKSKHHIPIPLVNQFTQSQVPLSKSPNQSYLNNNMNKSASPYVPGFQYESNKKNPDNSVHSALSPNFSQNIQKYDIPQMQSQKPQQMEQQLQQQQPNRVTFSQNLQQNFPLQSESVNLGASAFQPSPLTPLKNRKIASFKSKAVKDDLDYQEELSDFRQAMEFCSFVSQIQVDNNQNTFLNSNLVTGASMSNVNTLPDPSENKQQISEVKNYAKNMYQQEFYSKNILEPEFPFLNPDQKLRTVQSEVISKGDILFKSDNNNNNNNNLLEVPKRNQMTFSSKTEKDVLQNLLNSSYQEQEEKEIKKPEKIEQPLEVLSQKPLKTENSYLNTSQNNQYKPDTSYLNTSYQNPKPDYLNYKSPQINLHSAQNPQQLANKLDTSNYNDRSYTNYSQYQTYTQTDHIKTNTSPYKSPINNNIDYNNNLNSSKKKKYHIDNDINSSECDDRINYIDQRLNLKFKLDEQKAKGVVDDRMQFGKNLYDPQQKLKNLDLQKPFEVIERMEQYEKDINSHSTRLEQNLNRLNNPNPNPNNINKSYNNLPNYSQYPYTARYEPQKSFNFQSYSNQNTTKITTPKADLSYDNIFSKNQQPYKDFLSRQKDLEKEKEKKKPIQQEIKEEKQEKEKENMYNQSEPYKFYEYKSENEQQFSEAPAIELDQLKDRYMTYEDQQSIRKYQSQNPDKTLSVHKSILNNDSPPVSQKDLLSRKRSKSKSKKSAAISDNDDDEDSIDLSPKSQKSNKSKKRRKWKEPQSKPSKSPNKKINQTFDHSRNPRSQKPQKQFQQQQKKINQTMNPEILTEEEEESPERQLLITPQKTPYDKPIHPELLKKSPNTSSFLSSQKNPKPTRSENTPQKPQNIQQQRDKSPRNQMSFMPSAPAHANNKKYWKNMESPENPMLPRNRTPPKSNKYAHVKSKYMEPFKNQQKNTDFPQVQKVNLIQNQRQNDTSPRFQTHQNPPYQYQQQQQPQQYYESTGGEESGVECAQVHLTLNHPKHDYQQQQFQEQNYPHHQYENTAWDQYDQQYSSNNNSQQENFPYNHHPQQQYYSQQPQPQQQHYYQQQQQEYPDHNNNTLELNFNKESKSNFYPSEHRRQEKQQQEDGPEIQYLNIQDILQEISSDDDYQTSDVKPQAVEKQQYQHVLDNNLNFSKKSQKQQQQQYQQYQQQQMPQQNYNYNNNHYDY